MRGIAPSSAVDNPSCIKSDEEYDPAFPTRYDLLLQDRVEVARRKTIQTYSNAVAAGHYSTATLSSASNPTIIDMGVQQEVNVPAATRSLGDTTASRIMEKMGWEAGQGLGIDKQGIKNPLVAQKISRDQAIVKEGQSLHQPEELRESSSTLPYTYKSGLSFNKQSRIVCVMNLATRGNIPDIEERFADLLADCGNLLDIRVETSPVTPAVAAYEEVRAFFEFEHEAEAVAALALVHGKMFFSRQAVCVHYDEKAYLEKKFFAV